MSQKIGIFQNWFWYFLPIPIPIFEFYKYRYRFWRDFRNRENEVLLDQTMVPDFMKMQMEVSFGSVSELKLAILGTADQFPKILLSVWTYCPTSVSIQTQWFQCFRYLCLTMWYSVSIGTQQFQTMWYSDSGQLNSATYTYLGT